MTERKVTVEFNLNLVTFFAVILLLHAALLISRLPHYKSELEHIEDTHSRALKITRIEDSELQKIRKIGEQGGKGLNQVLVNKGVKGGVQTTKKLNPFQAVVPRPSIAQVPKPAAAPRSSRNPYRPDTRPTALSQLMQKAEPVQQVATRVQHAGASALAGSPTLSKSLMNMQVEVPEGVAADELNEFELQFYGFQKRLVSKYLNSIELQVREYEKRFSIQSLNVAGKHVMTGRVTFDSDGNIKQIKMLRWTQADRLQAMFEDILKSMMSLPNPPKMLRNSNGEFVVFYTLTVDNG